MGPENTAAALPEGLKAFARSPNVPSLQELAAGQSARIATRGFGYAFSAGMDELWLETPSVTEFSDEHIEIASLH